MAQRWKSILSHLVLVVYLLIVCDENRGSTAISLPSPHADQPRRITEAYFTLKDPNPNLFVPPSVAQKNYERLKDISGKVISGKVFTDNEAKFENTINSDPTKYDKKRIMRELTFTGNWYSYHENVNALYDSDSYVEKHIYDSNSIASPSDLNKLKKFWIMLDQKNQDMCNSPGQRLTERQVNTFACITKAELQGIDTKFKEEIDEINKEMKSTLCVQQTHTEAYTELEEYCHKYKVWNTVPASKRVKTNKFVHKVRSRASPLEEFSFTLLATNLIVRLNVTQKNKTHSEFDVTKVDDVGLMDVSLYNEKGARLTGNREDIIFEGHFRSLYGPDNKDPGLRSQSGVAATFSSLSNVGRVIVGPC